MDIVTYYFVHNTSGNKANTYNMVHCTHTHIASIILETMRYSSTFSCTVFVQPHPNLSVAASDQRSSIQSFNYLELKCCVYIIMSAIKDKQN